METSYLIEAYTEEEAIREAMCQFKKVVHIEKIKTGFAPKEVKLDKAKNKGKKTWVTKFYIYSFTSKQISQDTISYTGLKFIEAMDGKNQADALKRAEELTLKENKPMTVRIVKVLESGSNIVADVFPHKGIKGKWKITGTLRTEGTLRKVDIEEIIKEETVSS